MLQLQKEMAALQAPEPLHNYLDVRNISITYNNNIQCELKRHINKEMHVTKHWISLMGNFLC